MISHKHKCIFIHIPKTAGISIEKKILESVNISYNNRLPFWLGENTNLKIGPPRFAHLTYRDMLKNYYVSDELMHSYFKFSIVRDPVSRIISMYNYKGYCYICSFSDFVKYCLPKLSNSHWFFSSQYSFLKTESGDLHMDFIGKFESLQIDMKTICREIGIEDSVLKHHNKTSARNFPKKQIKVFRLLRDDPKSFLSYNLFNSKKISLNDSTKNTIYNLYKDDYKYFEYSI